MHKVKKSSDTLGMYDSVVPESITLVNRIHSLDDFV